MNQTKRNGVASSDDATAHGESLTLELNNLVNIVGINTGPWPLRHVTPNASSFPTFAGNARQQQSQLHYPAAQSFPGWRSAGVPSDPGTNGVDSGYGEPWHGFGWDEASSFQGAECPADTMHAGELLSGLEIGSADAVTGSTICPQVGSELQFYCKGCNTFLRKKSELNKHVQRHNKPHRCDYVGCPKGREGEGFSTTNDLIRHKKSVHGEHDKGPVYSCPYGSCAEKPDKVWPRADNFRSHLARSHQRSVTADSDLSVYVKNITKEPSGGATHSLASLKGLQTLPEQMLIERPNGGSDAETACVKGEGRILADISLTPAFDEPRQAIGDAVLDSSQSQDCSTSFAQHADCTQLPPAIAHGQPPCHGEILDHDAKLCQHPEELSPLNAPTFASTPRRINIFPKAQAAFTSVSEDAPPQISTFNELKEGGMKPAQIIAFLKTFPKSLLKNALENDVDTSDRESTISAYSHQRHDNICKECGKMFARPSELKKHQKRHDRPYRCTFRGCTKRFGSKNDWKRHEKKQHDPIDAWVCNIFGCNSVFSTAVLLHRHAQQDHDANHFDNMQSFLDNCHVGKSENKRFWCGYCSDVIGLETRDNQNLNLWVARCDHIDGHLSGKDGLEQKQFNQWIYLEDKISIDRCLGDPWDLCEESQTSRKRRGKSPFDDRPAKRREDYEVSDI